MLKTFVVLVLFSSMVFASTYAYDQTAATKFGRGVANATTGWIEIPKQIYLVSAERDPITGLIYGTAKGVCYTILRTTAGIFDAVTFPIPPYDKFLIEPEFIFEGWSE